MWSSTLWGVGTTFSRQYAEYLARLSPGIVSWQDSLEQILVSGLSPVRLSVQWNDCELKPGQYDFAYLDEQLAFWNNHPLPPVILCIGAKSPRWPEWHIPQFYENTPKQQVQSIHNFLQAVVNRYGGNPIIAAFQIENEPFELVGPNPQRVVVYKQLKQEIDFVRRMSSKPILLTMGAGTIEPVKHAIRRKQIIDKLLTLNPAAIGLNIYIKAYGQDWVEEIDPMHWHIIDRLVAKSKPQNTSTIISELQAEPWESTPELYNFTNPYGNPSFTISGYHALLQKVSQYNFKTILIWGSEFQLACAASGNSAWWNETKAFSRIMNETVSKGKK